MTNQTMVFPEPAIETRGDQAYQGSSHVKAKSNARFPCTHKKEPVDFQLLNILPWKNHFVVPL